MSCIVSRLLTDVTPARLRQLPFTGRRGQGVRRGLRTAPVGSPSCPPGTYMTEHSACTCIRMVFRTFIRIRICIRVRLGTFGDVITSIDIGAVHSRRSRRGCGFDPQTAAPPPQLPPPSGFMHENQISPTATLGNYNTPVGDHCDVDHNDHAGIYTTKDARAGCPVAMTGTKTARGGKPAPGRDGAVTPPGVAGYPASQRAPRAPRGERG